MNTTTNDHTFSTSVLVKISQEKAWKAFTSNIEAWWPKTHSIVPSGQKELLIEPFVNGRWYEVGMEGEQCDWGKVFAWDPFGRLVLTWQLTREYSYDKDFVTEVEVIFAVEGDSTRVTLHHKNLDRYGEAEAAVMEQFSGDGGWKSILAQYVRQAEQN